MQHQDLELRFTLTLDSSSTTHLTEFLLAAIEGISKENPKVAASRHALLGGLELPADKGLLVDTKQVAELLGLSARTVWRMQSSGEMPKSIRIGRDVGWSFEEIKAWTYAGCPPRDKWTFPAS